ncbi:MAG TPA: hypothetical protein VMS22_05815 [Candidatus Eisenbacteria bacterium]|nr:hypothetical protein [Candidatus Eisenbacteria bacterium]
MFRLGFWLVVLGVGWLTLSGTLPIPGIPDEEIVFATPPPVSTCGSSGCLAVYTLDLANTGRSAQESVKVGLRGDALANPAILPVLRRANGTTALQAASERGGVNAYILGRLEPEEQATLVFALRTPSLAETPGWDRILVGVETARGAARPGEPGALSGSRIVHATARMVERVAAAVRAAIAG